MITVKTPAQVDKMRVAGDIVRGVLELMERSVRPGVSTMELDRIAYEYITSRGAVPSFKGYNGFPASICASIDEEVVHGIPADTRVLTEGMIISVDVGAYIGGYHGDAARTFPVGAISVEKARLIEVTKESFFRGIAQAVPGKRLGDIGSAIQTYAEGHGYSVVRALVGHGIGTQMHEDPQVPNYGRAGTGIRLSEGMALAIEPMINAGTAEVDFCSDGWTVKTRDRAPSAHYENTIVVVDGEPLILTL